MVGDGYDLVHHPELLLYLLEHMQHGAVVLLRHYRLIARLPREAADDGVQGFRSISGDRYLFRLQSTNSASRLATASLLSPAPSACGRDP